MIGSALSNSSRHDAGFTVAEVLVVLALVGLLTGVLFGSLRFGLQAWEGTTSRSIAIDQNLLVQDFLRRTIALAYPSFVREDPTRGHVDFVGTETSISFVGPTPIARGVGGRSRFVVFLDQNKGAQALVVTAQSELAPAEAVSSIKDMLIANLSGVEFSYFGKSKLGPPEWRNSWASEVVLPQLVRMRVKFPAGDHRVWPELLIAPRIDADVSCVYDLLTKQCRGR